MMPSFTSQHTVTLTIGNVSGHGEGGCWHDVLRANRDHAGPARHISPIRRPLHRERRSLHPWGWLSNDDAAVIGLRSTPAHRTALARTFAALPDDPKQTLHKAALA